MGNSALQEFLKRKHRIRRKILIVDIV